MNIWIIKVVTESRLLGYKISLKSFFLYIWLIKVVTGSKLLGYKI